MQDTNAVTLVPESSTLVDVDIPGYQRRMLRLEYAQAYFDVVGSIPRDTTRGRMHGFMALLAGESHERI